MQANVTTIDGESADPKATATGTRARSQPCAASTLSMIPLERIAAPANPLRANRDPERLKDLAASVTSYGVIEPILVRRIEDAEVAAREPYELIAGDRRLHAAEAAGATHIPALVIECSDKDALELAITENIQREALNPLDEARALARMRDECGLSARATALRLGVGRGWVHERLHLLSMPDDVQALVSGHPDTSTHARELCRVADPVIRRGLIERIAEGSLPLAELRLEVRRLARVAAEGGGPEEPSPGASAADREDGSEPADGSAQVGLRSSETAAPSGAPSGVGASVTNDLAISSSKGHSGASEGFANALLGDLRSLQRSLLHAKLHVTCGRGSALYSELETTADLTLALMTQMEQMVAA